MYFLRGPIAQSAHSLIHHVSRSHTIRHTPPIGLLWTINQLVA